jgi:hypothetical protein
LEDAGDKRADVHVFACGMRVGIGALVTASDAAGCDLEAGHA